MYNTKKLENFREFSAKIKAETQKECPDMRLIMVWLKVLNQNHENLYREYINTKNIVSAMTIEK